MRRVKVAAGCDADAVVFFCCPMALVGDNFNR